MHNNTLMYPAEPKRLCSQGFCLASKDSGFCFCMTLKNISLSLFNGVKMLSYLSDVLKRQIWFLFSEANIWKYSKIRLKCAFQEAIQEVIQEVNHKYFVFYLYEALVSATYCLENEIICDLYKKAKQCRNETEGCLCIFLYWWVLVFQLLPKPLTSLQVQSLRRRMTSRDCHLLSKTSGGMTWHGMRCLLKSTEYSHAIEQGSSLDHWHCMAWPSQSHRIMKVGEDQ